MHPKDRAQMMAYLTRPAMARGGMLVQPGFGGTRQGYAGRKTKRLLVK